MYTERAIIKFHDLIPQSDRFAFLSQLAGALESVRHERPTPNPGFSIDADSSGKTIIVIWHPIKRNQLFSELRRGFEEHFYEILSPAGIVES